MGIEEIKITIRLPDGSTIPAIIQRKHHDQSCWLRLRSTSDIDEESTSTDYFEAFAEIRGRLAKRNIFPLCYGASRNIWPSAVGRGMGQGLKAYKLQGFGIPAKEIVNIFSTGPDIEPVPPEEQRIFAKEWLNSLIHEASSCDRNT